MEILIAVLITLVVSIILNNNRDRCFSIATIYGFVSVIMLYCQVEHMDLIIGIGMMSSYMYIKGNEKGRLLIDPLSLTTLMQYIIFSFLEMYNHSWNIFLFASLAGHALSLLLIPFIYMNTSYFKIDSFLGKKIK